jgi:hypothetical protein
MAWREWLLRVQNGEMIEAIERVSDGIVIVFADGIIKYVPESTLRSLDTKDGCQALCRVDQNDRSHSSKKSNLHMMVPGSGGGPDGERLQAVKPRSPAEPITRK